MSLVITVVDGKRIGDRFDDNWNTLFSNKKTKNDEIKWNKIVHCKMLNILIYTQVQRLSQICLLPIINKTIATSVNWKRIIR